MKLHEMSPANGEKTSSKRLGRGIGSGLGKTSGKGHKGQWARSGGGVRPGFEGGQMPLTRRIPKRGFTNIFKKEYTVVNVGVLSELFAAGEVVNAEAIVAKGLVSKIAPFGLKVLGGGEITKALTVEAARFSESAKAAIVAAGGTVVEVK
ncbi:MAG: 50S ribosomal protein L15 [Clostridia bacterium]|jgi:large subunit ribosomal protein L15|nr:50S ribosomal protein L15 [Clostridia bacterium]